MSEKGGVTQPKGRKEIGDAGKCFWQRASESTTPQKKTRTSNESSEIQPGLNEVQQGLHRSIVIRDVTAVPIKKGRVIGREGGMERLVIYMLFMSR